MKASSANGLLLLASMAWGMGFIAQSTAMDDIGPLLFVGVRFLIAAVVMLPFAWIQYRKIVETPHSAKRLVYVKSIGISGFLFYMGMVLQQVGLVYTTVTKAGFLTALYVIFVPILLQLLFNQRQNLLIWPCAMLALVGVYLLNDTQIKAFNLGDYLVIACSVFWSLHVLFIGHIGRNQLSSVVIACGQFTVTGLLGILFHVMLEPILAIESALDWDLLLRAAPELLYTAVVAGAFAFSLQIIAQRHTSESSAAVLLSMEALFAALFAILFLDELGSLSIYVGCGLLFAAIILVQLIPASKAEVV